VYDQQLKGYKPTPSFKPKVATGSADDYLFMLSRSKTSPPPLAYSLIFQTPNHSRPHPQHGARNPSPSSPSVTRAEASG